MRDWINESMYRRLAFGLVAVLVMSAGVGLVVSSASNPAVGWSVAMLMIPLCGIPVGLIALAGSSPSQPGEKEP